MNGSGVDKALEAVGSAINPVGEELRGSGEPGETPAVPAAAWGMLSGWEWERFGERVAG
jgi:hypothetical protein